MENSNYENKWGCQKYFQGSYYFVYIFIYFNNSTDGKSRVGVRDLNECEIFQEDTWLMDSLKEISQNIK